MPRGTSRVASDFRAPPAEHWQKFIIQQRTADLQQ
jgi:hypothetical protein